jgi:hypothetical protein
MLSDSDKTLLAWALDCALTERDKVGMLKVASVLKAGKQALQEPAIQESVLGLIEMLSPKQAQDIREFLKQKPRR